MERQRRQHGEAAAVLHAALVCVNRSGACREPITLGMFTRPNLKGLQAVLHLLHLRIRGPARTKKELQHIYPVLEPAQAREFKNAMQAWVRELGAAGVVSPDTVKYFVSAYQGSSSHRTVLMLLDLCALALAKELGPEGPHATLAGAGSESTPPGTMASGLGGHSALRQAQARLDAVVAAMQRLKQLHGQAAGQLACGQGSSGSAMQQLASRMPPLFAGSQATNRRGELVHELLSQGPLLTGNPEAVGPESWADLLAAGRGAGGAAGAAPAAAPATARRLSNPAQEASNFAAEGLAADADVLTVHQVLVQRLAASGAALQAAGQSGAVPSTADMRTALAEAAAYREALMLSVRQELAAAKVRAEGQAPSSSSSAQPTFLQLPQPGLPPCNPVLEGMQAAQKAAAAAGPADSASGSCGWATPAPKAVRALRRCMWQRAQSCSAGSSPLVESEADPETAGPLADQAAPSTVAAAAADTEVQEEPAPPSLPRRQQQQQQQQQCLATPAAAHGSSSSKVAQPSGRAAAAAVDSPNFADMLSNVSRGLGLGALPLLSDDLQLLDDLPEELSCGPLSPQQQQPLAQQQQQQRKQAWPPSRVPLGSPCMAESCASASMVADNHCGTGPSGSRSASAAAAAEAAEAREQAGRCKQAAVHAVSPMLSAAASFMQPCPHHHELQQQQQWAGGSSAMQQKQLWAGGSSAMLQQQWQQQPPGRSARPPLAGTAAGLAARSPLLAPYASLSPAGHGTSSTPHALRRMDSSDADDSPMCASGGSSRQRAASITFTLTPPRRLEESPLLPRQGHEQQQQQRWQPASAAVHYCDGGSGDATPASKLTRAAPPALQPVQMPQQQQQHSQPPDSPFLMASCLKSTPGPAPRPVPFATPGSQQPAAGHPSQPQARWALAARSSSPAGTLDSPQGSGASSGGISRRRSTLHTTSSPACRSGEQQRQRPSPSAGASPLLTPPRSLMATPDAPGCASRIHAGSVENRSASSAAAASSCDGAGIDALKQRMARLGLANIHR